MLSDTLGWMFFKFPVIGVDGEFNLQVENDKVNPTFKLKENSIVCLTMCQPARVNVSSLDVEDGQGI